MLTKYKLRNQLVLSKMDFFFHVQNETYKIKHLKQIKHLNTSAKAVKVLLAILT